MCVERGEQHGSLNIVAVSLSLRAETGGEVAEMRFTSGGMLLCEELPAGRIRAVLRFPQPYKGPGEPQPYWETKSAFVISTGRTNYLTLDTSKSFDPGAPGWDETGWREMWDLRVRP